MASKRSTYVGFLSAIIIKLAACMMVTGRFIASGISPTIMVVKISLFAITS